MSNKNILLYDVMAASSSGSSTKSFIDAIINGLGRFGRSLGSLAQNLYDSGYQVNRATKTPKSTVWQIGNDEYNQTKGQSGYLCEATIVPHPVQNEDGEPTYSVQLKTISGLGDHSFTIQDVTQSEVSKAIKETMQAWDAQDNKTAESITTYATTLADRANQFINDVKVKCDELRKDVGEDDAVYQAIEVLEKEATASTRDLHKQFMRALRDAKSSDDKIQICKRMDDGLQDSSEEFNKAVEDLQQNGDQKGADDEVEVEEESEVNECVHPTGNQIVASVTKVTAADEITYKLNRIVADVDTSVIKEALETVLYDASVAETIPENTECVLQLTEEPESWDVEMLSQQTSLDVRDACVEMLKTLYIALFNVDAIYFNSYGLEFPQLFESVDPVRDMIKDLKFIVSRICAEQTHFWPQPLTYLTPDNLLDPSTGFTAESGLIALSDIINKVVECVDLYRCNFSEFDQSQIITDIDNLNVMNSQIALKLQK